MTDNEKLLQLAREHNEKLYKLCILDLLVAIDEDVVDWRKLPELSKAIKKADNAIDLWRSVDNLKEYRDEFKKAKDAEELEELMSIEDEQT
jgi:hypothetical protein